MDANTNRGVLLAIVQTQMTLNYVVYRQIGFKLIGSHLVRLKCICSCKEQF